jgi:SNF2 family DNA or RNA helicase
MKINTLYDFQKNALSLMENRNHCGFMHSMGLGKTITGSVKLHDLGAEFNLLICQKSKIRDWQDHFQDNFPDIFTIDFTKTSKLLWRDIIELKKTMAKKVLVIVNYELAWRRKELLNMKHFTLMLDESSLIQNPKAKQTKFILKLNPDNVILLSGTPCSGKYENLWTQAHLLGWQISQEVFEQTYVNWESFQVGQSWHKRVCKREPYKNVLRLKEKLREKGMHFLKTEEVIELPEQVFTTISLEPSKEYTRFIKDSIVTIDDREYVGNTPLSKMMYAREICAFESPAKIDALKDILQSTNERLVVFYNFTRELHKIEDLCIQLDRPVSIVNGFERDLVFYESEPDAVTIVQYQAGAMGLNLQKSSRCIFFSPPVRVDHWMQAQKRIHRIGQERPCFYTKLVIENSIENSIYQALDKGFDYTMDLFKEESK